MSEHVAVLRNWKAPDGRSGTRLYFWCIPCDTLHAVEVKAQNAWEWNGNLKSPTVSPSVKVFGAKNCHSFVRNGNWEYLGDCDHFLASKTVPLPPLPDWFLKEVKEEADG